MKTILVTGGAGFIGSSFAHYVFRHRPDYRVVVLDAMTYAGNLSNIHPDLREDPERYKFVWGNVNNPNLVDQVVSEADMVVHFAAESHVSRSIYDDRVFFETDVCGTQTICQSLVRHRKRIERFVHVSSSEVYGTNEFLDRPMDEQHPLNPRSPYAAAKAGADRLVYSYLCTYDIPGVIVRPFNNYGPRQHLEKAVPRFITGPLIGESMEIHGDGAAQRDWIYVKDNVRAILALLEADPRLVVGEVFNIGSGRPTSIVTIARLIAEALGRHEDVIAHVSDRPGQVDQHWGDTSKIRQRIGWEPKVSLRDGIAKSVEWYRANRDWWQPLLWMRHVPVTLHTGETVMH
jgi:dTDP-glucose 4,6-dehydratase